MPGPSGWLPATEWSPQKWKVYRIEAALIPNSERPVPNGRIYLDQYVVQFTRNEVLMVQAMTTRDPHIQFRTVVEAIIKSFEFGPSEGTLPATPKPATATSPR